MNRSSYRPASPEQSFRVYFLVDPDTNVVRYVGSTVDPSAREFEHIAHPGGTIVEGTELGDWVRLRRQRKLAPPRFVVVEQYPNADMMEIGESFWISYHREFPDEGPADLLNAMDGGPPKCCFVRTLNLYLMHSGRRWRTDAPVKKGAVTSLRVTSIPTVFAIECDPDRSEFFDRDGHRWLNVYEPPEVKPVPGEHPRVDRLLRYLTNGDEAGVRYLTHWLARKVQRPGEKNMNAVVLHGQQGTGKDTLAMIAMEMVGRENCSRIGQAQIETRFNAPFATKLLIVADEVINRDNLIDTSSPLKQYITDETVPVEQKFVNTLALTNRMSWIFTSNASVPVRIEGDDDRRFSVFQNLNAPTDEHRQMLASMYGPKGLAQEFMRTEVAAFMHEMLELEVDFEMLRRPHANDARRLIAQAGESSVEAFGRAIREQGLPSVVKATGDTLLPQEQKWLDEGRCRTELLYAAYSTFSRASNYGVFSQGKFSAELKKVFPMIVRVRAQGEKRADSDSRKDKADRPWVYDGFPRLNDEQVPVPTEEEKRAAQLAEAEVIARMNGMKLVKSPEGKKKSARPASSVREPGREPVRLSDPMPEPTAEDRIDLHDALDAIAKGTTWLP